MSTSPPPPPPNPMNVENAGSDPTDVRGRRIGAVFIDVAVLLIPIILINFAFLEKRSDLPSCEQVDGTLKSCFQLGDNYYVATDGRVLASQAVGALLGIAYFVVLQGLTGWTVGKKLVGIRVVNAAGAICGLGKAFVRYLPFLIPALIPAVGPFLGILIVIAEFILILAHARRQRIGDLIAKTFVIRQDAVGWPVPER
jgi:uncharacterized RDD family membrane protein YckC